ncbi:glutamate racemase [Aequitasia blattaphilus]|uniref:Glutamate racemase n=1 Tax=Aequitasia blattaphilus TaxID=2949332 RepID=A0ABT1EAE5_9FIRM|nr:glutamate racemase [Aequitasia blattaphilus]MCP1102814.1 glutamate racemase [Aequitasia blattaphilus]MCR8615454.1 glutamate racemase [Aequitasia blattaphilus]
MKIGVFDSGIGGLSVLNEAMKKMPGEEFIYYGDWENVPYGSKSKEEVNQYVDEAVQFFLQKGVSAIVIACNTATSISIQYLREKYRIPIVGMEPAVKPAVNQHPQEKVLTIATPNTVKGGKLKSLIEVVDKNHLVDVIPMPKLVEFAENENYDSFEVKEYIKDKFKERDLGEYKALVLGCTHFNYFKESFRDVIPEDMCFVDGNEGTVNQLIRESGYQGKPQNMESKVIYFNSGVEITKGAELDKIKRSLKRVEKMREIV